MLLPPVHHKYAVKWDRSDKSFAYENNHSVAVNVSTTNGIVTGATIWLDPVSRRQTSLVWTEPSKYSSIVIFATRGALEGVWRSFLNLEKTPLVSRAQNQTDRVLADWSTEIP